MYPSDRQKYVSDKEAEGNSPMHGKLKGGFIDYEPESPEERCTSPEHQPPGMIVLPPGMHTYQCPACGKITRFRVQGVRL